MHPDKVPDKVPGEDPRKGEHVAGSPELNFFVCQIQIGQVITGRIMQDVPLSPGIRIKEGSKVVGHIVEVTQASTGKYGPGRNRIAILRSALLITRFRRDRRYPASREIIFFLCISSVKVERLRE
jgi:hypothetical protein